MRRNIDGEENHKEDVASFLHFLLVPGDVTNFLPSITPHLLNLLPPIPSPLITLLSNGRRFSSLIPARDVSRGGTCEFHKSYIKPTVEVVVQLPVQLLVLCMICENGLIPPYTILLNVPQWRWARRNVCRLQAPNHGQRDLYFSCQAKSRRIIYNWPVYGGRSLMNKGIRCMNKWVRKGRKERWNEWMNEWVI